MTYENELQQTRNRNRELDLVIRLIKKHPKTLNLAVVSETRAAFEHYFVKDLDPDIADRLHNEIVGHLEIQLKRSCWREFELVQLIKEKTN